MNLTVNIGKDKQITAVFFGLLMATYLVVFILTLRTYIIWQSVNLILGVICMPFIITTDYCNKTNKRFAFSAIVTIALAWMFPVKTLLFVSLLFGIFFLIENFGGKLNILPVLVCLLTSPFFQYVVSVFSFSIRIILSSVAGKLLNFFGEQVVVSGNIIEVNGNEFAVDPACMGLNMMVTSLLLGIVLIGVFQKRIKKFIRFWVVMALLVIISVFNIFSNLLRIILLVKFSILPEDIMHEITGLICLVVYVFIPSMLLVKWAINRFGCLRNKQSSVAVKQPAYVKLHLSILVAIVLLSFKNNEKERYVLSVPRAIPSLPMCTITGVIDNIIKIESSDVLIYVKPIENFYNSEHNPSICWKGSGYTMERINTDQVKNIKINTAELEKNGSTLFTAWWFDNGEIQTVNQLEWRWRMLTGSTQFSVINITAASKKDLARQLSLFFTKKISSEILLVKE